MKPNKTKKVLSFLKQNFPNEVFNISRIEAAYENERFSIGYYMRILEKTGEIIKIRRGFWRLKENKVLAISPITLSVAERKILDRVVGNVNFKSEKDFLRVGSNVLAQGLESPEERELLGSLLQKFEKANVVSRIGPGTRGLILEINKNLFLEYFNNPELIMEELLSNAEIDQKIYSFLSEQKRIQEGPVQISDRIENIERQLLNILVQIETLEKTKDSLENELERLKESLSKLECPDDNNKAEKQLYELLNGMSWQERRAVFKKIVN